MSRSNPSIEELNSSDEYELYAELEHHEIKTFVLDQLGKGGWLVKSYMFYQIAMILTGLFLLTRSIVLCFKDVCQPLSYSLGTIVFCVSVLIVIHELIHGIVIKLTGAPKVNYGAYFKKFMFYAEADRYVLNQRQFTLIALAPLVVVKIITLCGIILFFHQAAVYAFVLVMCIHSLFCAGDIGLLSVFHSSSSEIFTYDVRSEQKSYYFRKK
ncbi:DUF3267 domain-containing protein [Draconibacterium sp. IB214405]|uniref:DUF3267 domain-containing protein n=1 Tax=Draconibacterium sp. IB214405 TaxID=3097352 RepID=UPI002A0CF34E|nr:DUF3267 domain-containing protein [Draconibacterium sp. IB214405]MDX8337587.1 DUF3267 domain-containing protein [Draconibacterium sp. IB214405]